MKLTHYFTKLERILWSVSSLLILLSFAIFDKTNYMTLIASLLGVTSIIICAKGNPIGQLLMIIFSLLYGIISYSFAYYGEMLTYLGMTMPMAIFALISWIRHPYNGNKTEVEVNHISQKEIIFMLVLTLGVTSLFGYVLGVLNTANLLPSTLSVSTSFIAVYLCFRRSPYFSLAYAANDIILIILWTLASITDTHYISVVVCFIAFLANDIYAFYNWRKMLQRQAKEINQAKHPA